MKKFLITLLVYLILFGMIPVTVFAENNNLEDKADLFFDVAPKVKKRSVFPVNIRYKGKQKLYGIQFQISYDPNVLELVDLTGRPSNRGYLGALFSNQLGDLVIVQNENEEIDGKAKLKFAVSYKGEPKEELLTDGVVAKYYFRWRNGGVNSTDLIWDPVLTLLVDDQVNKIETSLSNTTLKGTNANANNTSNNQCVKVSKNISNDNDEVISSDCGADLTIPSGSLTVDSVVSLKFLSDDSELPNLISKIVEISFDTPASFKKPITLKINYYDEKLSEGEQGAIYYYNDELGRWIFLGGTSKQNIISVQIQRLGKFAVFRYSPKLYTDVFDHWAKPYIERLSTLDIINGYKDQTFRPDNYVTRVEFAKMLVKALWLSSEGVTINFADENKIPEWGRSYVAIAIANNLIKGYEEDGTLIFKPYKNITRAEMAVMVARAIKDQTDYGETLFIDQEKIPQWARNAIALTTSKQIINGFPDGTFGPGKLATRAEAAKVLYMLLKELNI
ncbi:hypothetical protein BHF71_02875 [Vulcanibacillus modesticaldus]|uniref:SLH domain-containing protein n=1 Tax=Vulcanibacillus modesticaldus TaxID=337097 RepID=A0A1D2YT81_9BACI|nr:S-layer homology domain-containing protein [Vulcanibacillus modesticaldus]OEF98887.1 hypothetical protein BHF71_02875 [Vulcanibacillus modesticaldus]